MTAISPGGDFLELILNCNKNKLLAGNIPVIKSPLSFFWVWEGGRREERREDASKLDAVFVDQCFVQCLLA